jgi:hypothetical protein
LESLLLDDSSSSPSSSEKFSSSFEDSVKSDGIDSAKRIVAVEIRGFLQLYPPSLVAVFQMLAGVLVGFHVLQVPTKIYT